MFFVIAAILLTGLVLLRKFCPTGFCVVQITAAFFWVLGQYNEFFSTQLYLFPLWVLASLAALATKKYNLD